MSLRPKDPQRLVDRVLVANLVLEVFIVVTGGIVRVTRSGLGCPTWPRCTASSFVPVAGQSQGFHKFIEFGNRTLTGVVSVAAILVAAAILHYARERTSLRRLAFLPLLGVLLQAVIGGISVRMKLSPVVVSLHMLASMVLVALSAYLLARYREGDGEPVPVVRSEVTWLARTDALLGAGVIVLGTIVTGTGPHSGDIHVKRYPFDPRSASWLHADLVMLFLGIAVAVWLGARLADDARARSAWHAVLIVTVLQGVLGYVQYFTKLPVVLVVAHMLGASLLVVALTFGVLALRRRGPAVQAASADR